MHNQMKKIFLLLAILLSGFLNAQTGTTSAGQFKMTTPVLGTVNDSCVVWNGTDKKLKYIPLSEALSGVGASTLEQTTTAGKTTTKGITMLVPTSGDPLDSYFNVKLNSGSYVNGLTAGHKQTPGDRTGFLSFLNVEDYEQLTIDNDKVNILTDTKDINYLFDKTKANGNYTLATLDDITGGATNLGYTASPTNGIVTSDTGTDATLPLADTSDAGLLAPADKTKLNNTSGTNTGDQTSIVGITGTMAQYDTSVTDGNFVYQSQALGTPSSGTLTNATGLPISTGVSGLGTGVATFLATPSSANFASAVTGETGTGNVVFSDSPTLTGTPNAPTQSANDNTTKVATTAYADAKVQNSMSASTTIAPSATAVNTALALKADIPTGWTAYGGTSTVVGCSSYTTKLINYIQNGKEVIVQWDFEGTSDSTQLTFTIPFTTTAIRQASLCAGLNNVSYGSCMAFIDAATSTIKVVFNSANYTATNTWTSGVTKRCFGQMTISSQ